MRKNVLIGLALASSMALAPFAIAVAQDGGPGFGGFGGGHGFGGHHGHRGGHFAKLNLTDAQKAQIKEILKNSRGKDKTQFQAVHDARKALNSLTPTDAGFKAAVDKLAQAEGAATVARVQHREAIRAQIYAVLTPAQRAQLATFKAQREARAKEWKEFQQQHKSQDAAK